MRLPRMNYKKITLKVILDVSAEEDHIIDLEDRNEIKEAVTNAIRQQYENGGFDIAYCFVDGFSVTQDADRSRDDAGAADPRNDRE